MKKNIFTAYVTETTSSCADLSAKYEAERDQLSAVENADEYKARDLDRMKWATKAKYVDKLTSKMTDKAVALVVSHRVTEAQLDLIISDSYQVKKFIAMFELMASEKSVTVEKHTGNAFAFFANHDFDTFVYARLAPALPVASDRQCQMYCKLFENLGMGQRIGRGSDKTFEFNKDHGIVKALVKLYS